MNQSDRQKLVREVFESTLSRAEVDAYVRHAVDPTYWQRLNPDLSIGGTRDASELEAAPLDEPQAAAQLQKLSREGYFQTDTVLAPEPLRQMRLAIERLRAEGWPSVFTYIYDEFWLVSRTPSLLGLLSGFLGNGCRQNSLVWTFYIPPTRGAQGWEPHSDSGGDKSRLTVWIPLTNATLENGCMYVIPRDRLPENLRGEYRKLGDVTKAQLGWLLQSTRALPSPAGAYLGWNHELIHWGSVSTGTEDPRISMAMEFLGSDVVPREDELPLFDPLAAPPPFGERLRTIGKGLLAYKKNEPSKARYAELGRVLTGVTP